MMKLKYLFSNEDLAIMILKNWEYDLDSIDMFKYYRISANAIYPFRVSKERCFLRFTPVSEKCLDNIAAELEFIEYLHCSGYPSVEILLSKNNNRLEVVETPWGEYFAVVFKGVPGIAIDEAGFDDDIIFGYGQALGKLHKLSSEYIPQGHKRWSWEDVLDWSCEVLSNFSEEALALKEARLLKDYLPTVPITDKNFGLVHFDFETDNVFYEAATNAYHPIDFDDAMYHWYALDIGQTIESLKDDAEQEQHEHIVDCFIRGYRSEFDILDDMLALVPVFKRFRNLYGYARVLRSIEEKWNNEPEWMGNLRVRLGQILNRRAEFFGENI